MIALGVKEFADTAKSNTLYISGPVVLSGSCFWGVERGKPASTAICWSIIVGEPAVEVPEFDCVRPEETESGGGMFIDEGVVAEVLVAIGAPILLSK